LPIARRTETLWSRYARLMNRGVEVPRKTKPVSRMNLITRLIYRVVKGREPLFGVMQSTHERRARTSHLGLPQRIAARQHGAILPNNHSIRSIG
jgi:hypothetical protein